MGRCNQNPRKAAMHKIMGDFLKENDISLKDGVDVVMTVSSFLLEGSVRQTIEGG